MRPPAPPIGALRPSEPDDGVVRCTIAADARAQSENAIYTIYKCKDRVD